MVRSVFRSLGLGLRFFGLVGTCVVFSATTFAARTEDWVIRDVRVFDGEQMLPARSVLLRDGRIADPAFQGPTPAGAQEQRCENCTLLPGLMDAHVHAYQDRELALPSGVTSLFDLFMPAPLLKELRTANLRGESLEADLFSAGTLLTTPGGHAALSADMPTLRPDTDVEAFVAARIAEGSDFIKLVLDDGHQYGHRWDTPTPAQVRAVVRAAKARGKQVLAHVSDLRMAELALEAGVSGLAHLFFDVDLPESFAKAARDRQMFVIVTASASETWAGRAGSAGLADVPYFSGLLDGTQRATLMRTAGSTLSPESFDQRLAVSVRRLRAAGVPILAGSDAGNPGVLLGLSLHRELELLVQAGMTPVEALRAATSAVADAFGRPERGRIRAGLQADLLLVEGDPSQEIQATRRIVAVWKNGRALKPAIDARRSALASATPTKPLAAARAPKPENAPLLQVSQASGGALSLKAPQGSWGATTDAIVQGQSTVQLRAAEAPAHERGLRVEGALASGFPYPWAGLAWSPGAQVFSPADLSASKGLRFRVRGDGGEYALSAYWQTGGFRPASLPFTAGQEWQEVQVLWSQLPGFDASVCTQLAFVASGQIRRFSFEIADLALLP